MKREELTGRRILIVDDDPAVLAVVGEGLRMRGCEVCEAEDPDRGLELARVKVPDLIVLDLVLPRKLGSEVIRELKTDSLTRDIPVMFLSAQDDPKERVKCLRLGAIDYVVKPFDLDELILRIDIGLRLKIPVGEGEPGLGESEEADRVTKTPKATSGSNEILSNEAFAEFVSRRVEKLNPETGLLSLALVRFDQEELLGEKGPAELRDEVHRETLSILLDLAPSGTVIGQVDPLQYGILVPRKNKYGIELMIDEARTRLALHEFHDNGDEHRVTFSCGVAEYPNPRIENGKQLDETAESALLRALRAGGDQTVLL